MCSSRSASRNEVGSRPLRKGAAPPGNIRIPVRNVSAAAPPARDRRHSYLAIWGRQASSLRDIVPRHLGGRDLSAASSSVPHHGDDLDRLRYPLE
jgi:hypothetical protein